MDGKYGNYADEQMYAIKKYFQKSIFFLLLYVDPETKDSYCNINITEAFTDLQNKLCGFNELLDYPAELIIVMSLLERALMLYQSGEIETNFKLYRKLILDAGAEMMKIGGGKKK